MQFYLQVVVCLGNDLGDWRAGVKGNNVPFFRSLLVIKDIDELMHIYRIHLAL